MEVIFHEKQEGSLCAQHCLNSLLQGAYFTAVDLSSLAYKLDEEERKRMAECGENSEEYQKFLKQPSGNMDDSGYFSVQVISSALEVWGLELVPYSSTDERVKCGLTEPHKMNAFICNYRDHWLTIRKIGNQWFNLNSLLTRPQLLSDTFLSLFLAQLKNEGYSIFVVVGKLPESTADQILLKTPFVPPKSSPHEIPLQKTDSDPQIQEAISLSLQEESTSYDYLGVEDDPELQEALRLSLAHQGSSEIKEDDEETMLQKAINMSLQC
ncbi:ataxin-3-like [Harmonia axyridis]|uniref:ataxin-3-like n=1 Tax=Harmonia axyridis TaxID=115357 RepID=UPI001E27649A|nr:ataxin-3-like [Harmonia axyridis]